MGEVGKLELTYGGTGAEEAPQTIMVKFPTSSPEVMAMIRPTRVYEREHRFYQQLSHKTPLRTPAPYHVTCETSEDPEVDEEYAILMEDLGGMTIGDQVAGLTAEQTAAALTGLAAHHAHFWNGVGLEGLWFVPPVNGPLNMKGAAIYDQSLPGFKEVFGDTCSPELLALADVYGANYPKFLELFAAMPDTLVHFDYRADNLFFDRGDGSVAVIDWQSISKGGGAADVGYLLGQNLDNEVRREHEDDLLHTYHDGLVSAGVTGYSFEQLFEDHKVGLIYGWVIPVFAVGTLDASSERAMTLWTRVIERVEDAIFQHEADLLLER